jgi:hypothetical protein
VVVGCGRISDNGICPWGSAFGRGFAFFSCGMAACRGNMLVFRRVGLVLRVVVWCGRISDNGVCPRGVLSGLVSFFFRAGWLLVAERCLGSGEVAWVCAWWWGSVESPIMGSVPGECCRAWFRFFSCGLLAHRENTPPRRRIFTYNRPISPKQRSVAVEKALSFDWGATLGIHFAGDRIRFGLRGCVKKRFAVNLGGWPDCGAEELVIPGKGRLRRPSPLNRVWHRS